MCRTAFTVLSRIHHCRLCGKVLCRQEETGMPCAAHRMPLRLTFDGCVVEVIVCPACHSTLFSPDYLRAQNKKFDGESGGEEDEEQAEGPLMLIKKEYGRLRARRHQITALLAQYELKVTQWLSCVRTNQNLRFTSNHDKDNPVGRGSEGGEGLTVQEGIEKEHDLGNEVESCRQTALLVMGVYEGMARSLRDLGSSSTSSTEESGATDGHVVLMLQEAIYKGALGFLRSTRPKLHLRLPDLLLVNQQRQPKKLPNHQQEQNSAQQRTVFSASLDQLMGKSSAVLKPFLSSSYDALKSGLSRSHSTSNRTPDFTFISISGKEPTEQGPKTLSRKLDVQLANLPALMEKMGLLADQRLCLEKQILEAGGRGDVQEALFKARDEIDEAMLQLQVAVSKAPPPAQS